jgi:N-acylglucosamine 2-epimerase
MDRRVFGQMFLATLGTPVLSSLQTESRSKSECLDVALIRDQYKRDLFNDFLPFHDRFVIDHKYGGFLCSVRPNGERVSDAKPTWYQGRGLWVYSFLYNNFARDQKYLDTAAGAYRMVERSSPEGRYEFFPKDLNRDGSPASGADKDIYGDMFVAEGLVEFSRASGDTRHWDRAREIVLKCVHNYDQPNYNPEIGRTYLGPSARLFPGARVQGHWLVLIRVTTQMLEIRGDDQLEAISNQAIDAVLNHHYNPRYQLISELLNHDLSRPANEYEQFVYAAHAIEITWMILYEARRRGDRPLFDKAANLFKRHCEVSRDRVYGGLLRSLNNVDQNTWSLDKTLFPHQEAIIGAMCLIEESGDPWAIDFFLELNQYMHEKFPMKSLHSPLWQVTGDRWVTPDPEMTRAENYHQPRFLMLSLLTLERLIKRGEQRPCSKLSDLGLMVQPGGGA